MKIESTNYQGSQLNPECVEVHFVSHTHVFPLKHINTQSIPNTKVLD